MKLYKFIFLSFSMLCIPIKGQTSFYNEKTIDNSNSSYTINDSLKYAIRGNLLSWATLAPHLEFEMFWKKHWNCSLGGGYGWWGFDGTQHTLQTWKVTSELRYYFNPNIFEGHGLGLRLEMGQFDYRFNKYGRRGKLNTLGLTYSYTWKISKNNNWFIDCGIGAGYINANYIKYIPYKPLQCYYALYRKKRNVLGITSVSINLGYRFPLRKKNSIGGNQYEK